MCLFPSFKQHLRIAAKDAATLLASFETPPTFELWNNPVTQHAKSLGSLAFAGGRTQTNTEIFKNCYAQNLCDDGCGLVDGGISKHHRLWLIYQFDSLTDYDGHMNYTTIVAVISAVKNALQETELVFGFDWNRPETLSRLIFDAPDATLAKTVFDDDAWRSLHRVAYRPIV